MSGWKPIVQKMPCSNSNHTVSILWCLMCKWQAWGDSLCCAVSNSTGRIYPYC
ncbi:Uncharacterised protein [Vibrio cholerae]|nr:Uncharacterised protein [Vibrio cholerae]CSI51219.1 Uncharacterised protein [Vibrio cholerae]